MGFQVNINRKRTLTLFELLEHGEDKVVRSPKEVIFPSYNLLKRLQQD